MEVDDVGRTSHVRAEIERDRPVSDHVVGFAKYRFHRFEACVPQFIPVVRFFIAHFVFSRITSEFTGPVQLRSTSKPARERAPCAMHCYPASGTQLPVTIFHVRLDAFL